MNFIYFLTMIVQVTLVFAISTILFDALHYWLHRWQTSRFALLRTFSNCHMTHHKFLNEKMDIAPKWWRLNLWLHIVPAYIFSLCATAAQVLVFDWIAVAIVIAIHTSLFAIRVLTKGKDIFHQPENRLSGQRGAFFITPTYHALHHVYPNQFFSTWIGMFDALMGTSCPLQGRRVLVTGASSAFGESLIAQLEKRGAIVDTAKFGEDYEIDKYDGLSEKLRNAELLVLAHGSKTDDCWSINYTSYVDLIEKFRVIGKDRLTPPEVWALGSEAELLGDMGIETLKPYAHSKRAFAVRARELYKSADLTYRHIVPAAFTSRLGKGLLSTDNAAALAMFLIRRGFTYVPVGYTSLPFWNYIQFRFMPWPKTARRAPMTSKKSV